MCNCLTYASLAEIPEFSSWTVSKGRLECVECLYSHLYPLFNRKRLVQFPEDPLALHEIVYPRKGLEDVIAMGLERFLEKFSEGRGRGRGKVTGVRLHKSGLMLPVGCEVLPSESSSLPTLITRQHELETQSISDQRFHRQDIDIHLHPEEVKTDTQPSGSPQASTPVTRGGRLHHEEMDHGWVERGIFQDKDHPEDKNKKPKGTSWSIEFDTPPQEKLSQVTKIGGELQRERPPSEAYRPPMSPYYSATEQKYDVKISDHPLPPPPTHQPLPTNFQNGDLVRLEQSEKYLRQQSQSHHSDEHSLGSKSTTSGVDRRDHSVAGRNDASARFPRWGQLPLGQSTPIAPVCVHRDSAPLRCISLVPSTPRQETLDDSLGLPHPPLSVDPTIIAIGSNSKSISLLSYDHSEGVTFGRVTIIDELTGVHNGSVYTLDWSNDSRYLASGSNDKNIRIISYVSFPLSLPFDPFSRGQTPSGPFSVRTTLKGHNGTIRTVKFSPHPALLASGGAGDCRMRVWDVNQGTSPSPSLL